MIPDLVGICGLVAHGAESAVTRTPLSKDHKGGCSLAITFKLVGAFGFPTDRCEVVAFQQLPDFLIFRSYRETTPEPLRFARLNLDYTLQHRHGPFLFIQIHVQISD
jgi:hypothetical protein